MLDTYNLQISTSSDFSSTVVNETELTSTSYTPSLNLLMGTQYYWRVSATNEGEQVPGLHQNIYNDIAYPNTAG